MQTKIVITVIILLCGSIYPQQNLRTAAIQFNSSLDLTTDARSIALGEGIVADPVGLLSYKNNPAALSGVHKANIFYSNRNQNLSGINLEQSHESRLYNVGVIFQTNFGNFAFDYSKFNKSYYDLPFQASSYFGKINSSDYTFNFSFARSLVGNLSGGINFKIFKRDRTIEGYPYMNFNTKRTYLVDIGLLYGIINLADKAIVDDKLSLGISLQNFGTDYTENYASDSYSDWFNSTQGGSHIPRYLRIGFSYMVDVPQKAASKIQLSVNMEYRNYLNPQIERRNGFTLIDDSAFRDYWGLGMEAVLFKIIALRVGGYSQPLSNMYGAKSDLNIRYGFGIYLPLEILGPTSPLTFRFDYTVIPINKYGVKYDQNYFDMFNAQLSFNY
ncbi:MAG: hypothetical protein NTX22_16700 [Ignavibacteriales bacterium]|nr:hypothetical protein [Ignavibacteriales bacterium]